MGQNDQSSREMEFKEDNSSTYSLVNKDDLADSYKRQSISERRSASKNVDMDINYLEKTLQIENN